MERIYVVIISSVESFEKNVYVCRSLKDAVNHIIKDGVPSIQTPYFYTSYNGVFLTAEQLEKVVDPDYCYHQGHVWEFEIHETFLD